MEGTVFFENQQRGESLLGSVIDDRYRIDGYLGEGAMGAVFRATQVRLKRPVALKVPLPIYMADDGFRQRFEREALALAKLQHENIVQIYDVCVSTQPGTINYLVMEYAPGRPLNEYLRAEEDMLTVGQVVGLFEDIARGLDAAHQSGIIHRDIKPANTIVLDAKPIAKVLDFGVARNLDDLGGTSTGVAVGTPIFMAPEQVSGERELTGAVDIYALAMTIYRELARASAFDATSYRQMMRAHINDEPTPVTAHNPSLPVEVHRIFVRGLAKEPEDRYPTAIALVEDLRVALGALLNDPFVAYLPEVDRLKPKPPLPADQTPGDHTRLARFLIPGGAVAPSNPSSQQPAQTLPLPSSDLGGAATGAAADSLMKRSVGPTGTLGGTLVAGELSSQGVAGRSGPQGSMLSGGHLPPEPTGFTNPGANFPGSPAGGALQTMSPPTGPTYGTFDPSVIYRSGYAAAASETGRHQRSMFVMALIIGALISLVTVLGVGGFVLFNRITQGRAPLVAAALSQAAKTAPTPTSAPIASSSPDGPKISVSAEITLPPLPDNALKEFFESAMQVPGPAPRIIELINSHLTSEKIDALFANLQPPPPMDDATIQAKLEATISLQFDVPYSEKNFGEVADRFLPVLIPEESATASRQISEFAKQYPGLEVQTYLESMAWHPAGAPGELPVTIAKFVFNISSPNENAAPGDPPMATRQPWDFFAIFAWHGTSPEVLLLVSGPRVAGIIPGAGAAAGTGGPPGPSGPGGLRPPAGPPGPRDSNNRPRFPAPPRPGAPRRP